MNKEFILSKEHKIKKQKIFNIVKNDFDNACNELSNSDMVVRKDMMVKNLKISKEILKRIIPYVITASVTFGSFSIFNVPFVRETKVDYDKNNLKLYNNSVSMNDYNYLLTIYNNWVMDDNGSYYRVVDVYSLRLLPDEQLSKILDNKFDYSDFIDKKVNSYKEYSSFVVNNVEEYELMINDGNDIYYYVKDSSLANFISSMLYVITTILIEKYAYDKIVNNKRYCKLEDKIREINYGFSNPDVAYLKGKYNIKEENYKRLMKNR